MRALLSTRARLIAPLILIGSSTVAAGQVANASSAATGLSGAYTARAQGYNAVNWNPANLAMPGNPAMSLALLAFDGAANLKPIDLTRIAEFSGKPLPASVREQWMQDVIAEGSQNGGARGGITALGLSLGPIAFQGNTKVSTQANLAPDIVEAILFGNAGRTPGTVKNLALAGSGMQASVYSTGAVSFGLPVAKLIPLANFALGATAKYTVGHALLVAYDDGSTLDSTVTLKFPAILPMNPSGGGQPDVNAGSGLGLDLGAAWTIPGFRFGVNLQNVFNTFKWDTTKLVSRNLAGTMSSSSSNFTVDSVDKPYANAPASLRARVADMTFKPVINAGMAFSPMPKMTVSVDVRQQFGDGMEVGPKSMISGGAEYKLIPGVPLRAGVSMMTGGFGVSGGLGLHVLGFETSVAGFLRKRDGGSEPGVTINVFSIKP